MDSVILIAAATLNPCARRKRTASSPTDTPPVSTGDIFPEEEIKSDVALATAAPTAK